METVKRIIQGGLAQSKTVWKVLLFAYIPIGLLFFLMYLVSESLSHVSLSDFSYDVTVLAGLPFYFGMLSQLGLILWSAAAAVCIFTGLLLGQQKSTSAAKRFLIHAAIITTVLLLDDAFLLHEDIGPNYLGIDQTIIFLLYGVLYLAFLFANRTEILNSEYLILGTAMFMFAASIFFDEAHLDQYYRYGVFFSERVQTFLEDGFKFVGVATWLIYFTRYAKQKILAPVTVNETIHQPVMLPNAAAARSNGRNTKKEQPR